MASGAWPYITDYPNATNSRYSNLDFHITASEDNAILERINSVGQLPITESIDYQLLEAVPRLHCVHKRGFAMGITRQSRHKRHYIADGRVWVGEQCSPAIMLSRMICTCRSRSGLVCSCQKPTTWPNSWTTMPNLSQFFPMLIACGPFPRFPTNEQHLIVGIEIILITPSRRQSFDSVRWACTADINVFN